MKIKLERKEKRNKVKKVPTIKVGAHKKTTIALWILLLTSIAFGVYKNFTAINQHTTHEKEVVKLELVDTTKIQSFVENFAKIYYSWEQDPKLLEQREQALESYLTPELQQLNAEIIRSDIPTASTAERIQFWSIEKQKKGEYNVFFSVEQKLTENKKSKSITSIYKTTVYIEQSGEMVIIQNPTVTSKPTKSNYEPKIFENDSTIDAQISEEVTTFLETFFKLYPKASKKELAYYVNNQAIKPIEKDYVFAELISPIYQKKGEEIEVIVTVKYLDNETKMIQLSQFHLFLEKQNNWLIIK
ncbi:conjugal transfer protein [Listeria seeligeri]|uniref:conjugal transfer protein n=1 Tax=Listeria seeligeri TaxID=1640 RepID=UPI001887797C|nr:conjugal transfer protein [Listeria seeligeri]MBF2397064.1 conjugal transfer protein [Listeria seeligeri]MBF2454407.1 conjugal transfer protein [Listeria seeligeri]MBF2670120.1 conjugal transfer protein [Listeria seeligeri]